MTRCFAGSDCAALATTARSPAPRRRRTRVQHTNGDLQPERAASNRHSRVAFSDHRDTRRGFLPWGLSNTCPQAGAPHASVSCDGQVSDNPKHEPSLAVDGYGATNPGGGSLSGLRTAPLPSSSAWVRIMVLATSA